MADDQPVSSTSISSQSSRVEWLWESDADPCGSEPTEWCAYSDVETAIIEEVFQQNLSQAILDHCTISFEDFVQISTDDTSTRRRIKRIVKPRENQLRATRFTTNPINPSSPFGPYYLGGFRRETHRYFNLGGFAYTHENSTLKNAANRRRIVERAAEGIIVEGNKEGKQIEAEWLAQRLRNVIDGTAEEVWRVCARLYTMESFLYKKLNECMRLEGDEEHEQLWKSKVTTLGPFSLLLYYLGEYTSGEFTVYRGCNLSDDMIQQYRQIMVSNPNAPLVFPAFTSTSKNRDKAERFGNVIFVIDVFSYYDGCNVSPHSLYDEDEFLLAPYFAFFIRSCEFDENEHKWIIRLRSARFNDDII